MNDQFLQNQHFKRYMLILKTLEQLRRTLPHNSKGTASRYRGDYYTGASIAQFIYMIYATLWTVDLGLDTNIPENALKIYVEILNFFPKNPSKNL